MTRATRESTVTRSMPFASAVVPAASPAASSMPSISGLTDS